MSQCVIIYRLPQQPAESKFQNEEIAAINLITRVQIKTTSAIQRKSATLHLYQPSSVSFEYSFVFDRLCKHLWYHACWRCRCIAENKCVTVNGALTAASNKTVCNTDVEKNEERTTHECRADKQPTFLIERTSMNRPLHVEEKQATTNGEKKRLRHRSVNAQRGTQLV